MEERKVVYRKVLKWILHISLILLVSFLTSLMEDGEDRLYRDLANSGMEDVLETFVKAPGGQIKQLYEMGAPHNFLSQYFPSWKYDHKTYMVPHQLEKSVYSSDKRILFDMLRQLGEQQMRGMFVIQGLSLSKFFKWNEDDCVSKISDTSSPQLTKVEIDMDLEGSDFIVFHHDIGIIHFQMCDHKDITNSYITDSVKVLEGSESLIKRLYPSSDILQWKIISLSSVSKEKFLRIDYSILQQHDNIILLFAEDMTDIISFGKWWKAIFKDLPTLGPLAYFGREYERILSYILMLRHLTPVTEEKYIWELSSSLNSYSQQYAYNQPQNFETKFPHILRWWSDIEKFGEAYSFAEAVPNSLADSFVLGLKSKNDRLTLKSLNHHLKTNSFVFGNMPSQIDKTLAVLISERHLLSYHNIIKFCKIMSQIYYEVTTDKGKISPNKASFNSIQSLNSLELQLSKASVFLEGEEPTDIDREIFEHLMCNFRISDIHLPLVLSSEQLKIFEGPQKQLIIGGPGSGKTELMKTKAKELAKKIMACEEEVKILYIVATGSPSGDPLLSYQVKKYFSKYPPVEVLTIIIEEEHSIQLEYFKDLLTNKMAEMTFDQKLKYQHVFIDEYWIGSKPKEHEIIIKLIHNIPGYVWISSVFNFHPDLIYTSEKMIQRTKPLLDALRKNNGIVSYIHQVIRGANNIITLEREYSSIYQGRTYPYGTKEMFGHLIEGFSVTWTKESDLNNMYLKCVDIVTKAVKGNSLVSSESLTLNAASILIVDFAVRAKETLNITYTLKEQLLQAGFSVWSFGDSMEEFMDCHAGKLTLLSSRTRTESTYLDGVEWPMVIVILPYGILLNKDSVADGAESLRNYDTYISFFRAQIKLVVISDKWSSKDEFLKDIALKNK